MAGKATGKAPYCSMYGMFNLRETTDIERFKKAFDAFSSHLKDQNFVHDWRMFKRSYHDGYDADFPDLTIMVEVRFIDRAAADASWAYVEAGEEPLRGLHRAVNVSIKQSMFVLFEAV